MNRERERERVREKETHRNPCDNFVRVARGSGGQPSTWRPSCVSMWWASSCSSASCSSSVCAASSYSSSPSCSWTSSSHSSRASSSNCSLFDPNCQPPRPVSSEDLQRVGLNVPASNGLVLVLRPCSSWWKALGFGLGILRALVVKGA